MKKQLYILFTLAIYGLTSDLFSMETSQISTLSQEEEIAPTVLIEGNDCTWFIKKPANAIAQIRYAEKYGFAGKPIITRLKIKVDLSDEIDENGNLQSNNKDQTFSSKVFTKSLECLAKYGQTGVRKISIADMNSNAQDKKEKKEMNKAFLSLQKLPFLRTFKFKGGQGNDTNDEYKLVMWKKIPQNIGFATVKKLNLENLQLEKLPVTVCYMATLQTLDLSCNNLTSLPDQIGNLSGLKKLQLDSNKLEELPETINRLTALVYLSFYRNKFSKFPQSIGDLPNLKEVNGVCNRMESWEPITKGQFPCLQFLSMSDNHLTKIPQGIEFVDSLERLDLNDNRITEIPLQIGSLKNLKLLKFKRNPIQAIPAFKQNGLLLDTEILFEMPSNNNNVKNKRKLNPETTENKRSNNDKSEE